MRVNPRQAKNITVMQALEWLAMGWTPYVDNDDRLASEDRERIRCHFDGNRIRQENEHFYNKEQLKYCTKMYKAVAVLENLLNTHKINLISDVRTYIEDVPGHGTSCLYGDLSDVSERKYIDVANEVIVFTSTYKDWGSCYCKIYDKCLSFLELKRFEPLTENIEQPLATAISENCYTTPEIEVINTLITKYGDKINKEEKGSVLNLIEQEAKMKKYKFSGRQTEAIFAVIRKPETKIGGAKKQAPTPDL